MPPRPNKQKGIKSILSRKLSVQVVKTSISPSSIKEDDIEDDEMQSVVETKTDKVETPNHFQDWPLLPKFYEKVKFNANNITE